MNRATDHLGTAKADGSGLGRLVHKCVRERCRPNLLTFTILIPNFFGFIMLLVATLFRAATLFAKRDAVRVGVVLGVNNGTNEEGVGRALTSDQEQWCANEGELLSLLYSIVHLQAGIALH